MKILNSLYNKIRSKFSKKSFVFNGIGEGAIYVSYITEPFLIEKKSQYFNRHQNLQETLIIARILKKYFKTVVFELYNHNSILTKNKYDVVFGIEPNFGRVCAENPNALKIYYATGAYLDHQNKMIKSRTDEFNQRFNVQYPELRLVNSHSCCEVADLILQIGSKFTIETYPNDLQSKISLINQSSHNFKDFDIIKKIKQTSKSDYIWFGSGGNILKGLDLVLNYFVENNKFNLHIVGPIESDFVSVYKDRLINCTHIKFYGFMDVDSREFREIANKCAFLIFPSASEGGCPGSVINLQKLGVIPIVSKWASSDDIYELGYQIKELNINSIIEGIIWSQSISTDEMQNLIQKNHNYSLKKHNIDRFTEEFESYIQFICKRYKAE